MQVAVCFFKVVLFVSAITSETARVGKSDVTSHMTNLGALTTVTLGPSVFACECINTADTIWDPANA